MFVLMLKPKMFSLMCLLLFSSFLPVAATAQCSLPISSFPYMEDFESNDGNWSINGFLPDWAWGAPSKPVISAAGGGNNCWVTGGLTGSFYNNGEASWLQSPCFDFSTLQSPYIKFKVFWETEGGFDGANLQYSLDNGASWLNVGSVSSASTCLNNNWYNTGTVSFLSAFTNVRGGWSGNIQNSGGSCRGGGGSNGWVVADQLIKELAGQSSVIFRFTFAAGTQCNNFDGFAIDDFFIDETPSNNGTISFNCVNSITVNFGFVTDLCPNTFSWDFNDIASAQNNISTSPDPTHTFSAPGIYNVSLTVSNDGNAPFTTSQTVTILGLGTQIVTPISCNGGATGTIKATVTGSSGPFAYSWNTIPVQTTNTAVNLLPGVYNVEVNAPDACPISAITELANPVISVEASVQQPGCLFEKGSIKINVAGGSPPYIFSWVPAVSTGSVAENLDPKNYSVTISDGRPCTQELKFTIATLPRPSLNIVPISNADCNGIKFGSAAAVVTGGTSPYTFLWDTNPAQITDTAINLQKGEHTLTITDANGCTDTKTVTVGIGGICDDIYFPNAIAPDGTGSNFSFGPLGNVVEISNYYMAVYNRYGQMIFSSSNPVSRWNGTIRGGKTNAGVYVWYSTFMYKKLFRKSLKGTITVIR
jgi:gliding motility-associated-like protein